MDAYRKGQRVQNIKLLERTTKKSGGRLRQAWLCLTDNGEKKVLFPSDIRKREQRGRVTTHKEACINRAYVSYQRNCRRRNVYLGITRAQFGNIVLKPCIYCGAPPANGGERLKVKYNGLDRKDNKRGYTPKNCVPCCKTCNSIKGEHLTFDEMLAVAKVLRKIRGKRRPG